MNQHVDPSQYPVNPKQLYGDKKPPLDYIPLSVLLAALEAFYDGKLKYGAHNWRERPVEAQTYIDAAFRHLKLFSVGEEFARDTKVKNLGAVIACCGILIDAALHGTMIDNRSKSSLEADLLHAAEDWVAALQAKQRERNTAKT